MGGRLPTPFLVPLLFLVPAASAVDGEHAPCVVPRGPPCISLSELRELERETGDRCVFEVGSCISFQWDEYGGDTIIEAAEVSVTPSCGRRDSAETFERKGRAYLETLQTIPFEVTVVTRPCAARGFVDVKVTKFRSGGGTTE